MRVSPRQCRRARLYDGRDDMDCSLLDAARLITPDGEVSAGAVLIEDGVITAAGPGIARPAGVEVIHLAGLTLVPGYIDLHVHGGGGFSLATHDEEDIAKYAAWAAGNGVTSFLAGVCAARLEEGLEFVRVAALAAGAGPAGAACLGVNLEGPFINGGRRGALPASWAIPPDSRTLDGIVQSSGGWLKLMTVAPEMPGADRLIRTAVARGITVSVGHTDADYDTALRAFESGATLLTHAFNAMRPFHHRDPGPIGAAIAADGATVEVIADGVHLHPATVRFLVRALGPDRVALVTDAVPPAGLEEGGFRLGGEEARLEGGRITLPDGTIAGSAATMDEVVRNVVNWGIAGLADAVRMASATPARVLGLSGCKGRIAAGYAADLVALDGDLRPVMTWRAGRLVYSCR